VSTKELLRNKYLDIRAGFSTEKIVEISREIKDHFFKLGIVEKSQNFLLYHSFGKEIITHELIEGLYEREKDVYLPYVVKEEKALKISKLGKDDPMVAGVFGIKEPLKKEDIPANRMDIIVVPGLLFDKNGYRIGYGGGYYDRLLKRIEDRIITIGLCFEDFLQESLPVEEYDIPVKIIISEKRVLYVGGGEY
jgi:5-formyltetrahydrofolate cyclo-ligase